MKRIISILCVLTLAVGMLALSSIGVSAVDAAQTTVDVKAGDEVSYILTLGDVPTPIIGCDFSVYFDSSLFEVESVADFTGSTDEGDWEAMINPALDGEVRGNWSILKGVDFSDARTMLTVNFKAKAAGSGHISYFIRYLYDESIFDSTDKPQITQYKFTCDVKVNGKLVIEKEQPELNTVESQNTGVFVNSLTGDSDDADASIPKTVARPDALSGNAGSGSNSGSGSSSGNNSGNGSDNNSGAGSAENSGSGNNSAANNSASTGSGTTATGNADVNASAVVQDASEVELIAQLGTDADGYIITATDAEGNVVATADSAADQKSGGNLALIWIIIALLVLAGGGAAVYFTMNRKRSA